MTPEQAQALREAFPPEQVGKLPKPYKKDAQKGTCPECGKWHGLPAMHLDFVGHGAVTDRLLSVDPEWTWEPMALDEHGLPALDRFGNLWIRLTIGGTTRIGVGDGTSMKVLIGDAIRNAAMRFGVALDLWVHGSEDEKSEDGETIKEPAPQDAPVLPAGLVERVQALPAEKQQDALERIAKRSGVPVANLAALRGLPAEWEAYVGGLLDHLEAEPAQPTLAEGAA